MYVTCHITFWQLNNFVGASLEERTIRNNKLHFTWGCSILFFKKKKGKGPWERIPFFSMILTFLKYFNSNHILPSYSLFLKCFSWFFYLRVHSGTGVFSWFFFSPLLSRVTRSRARLALASVWPKTLKNRASSTDPGLLNETNSSWFPLSCLSSYQNGW